MRIRDILLTSIVCLFLCGPALLFAGTRFSPSAIPAWLAIEDAFYLSGEETHGDVVGTTTVSGFASGAFQAACETEVGNSIPAKGSALMANAALQRMAIKVSNGLFGWECFPTFFSSSLVEVPSEERLMEMPEASTDEFWAIANEIASALDSFATRHPELGTFVYLGADSQNVEGAPAASLTSASVTYDMLQEVFVSNGEHYVWVSGSVDYDTFLEDWYKTDHHWNIRGAFLAYQRVATALGFGEQLLQPSSELVMTYPPFYGSFARRGLDDTYSDELDDYLFDSFPDLEFIADGAELSISELAESLTASEIQWNSNKFANRYIELFHTDYGLLEIRNASCQSGQQLLLVADSYSNCMERFLAAHYETVYVMDPRHLNETVDEFLSTHAAVTEVVFLMRSPNMLYYTTLDSLAV